MLYGSGLASFVGAVASTPSCAQRKDDFAPLRQVQRCAVELDRVKGAVADQQSIIGARH
jgi:hypothetical protein